MQVYWRGSPLLEPLSTLLMRTTATVPGALSKGQVMLNSFAFQGTLHPVCMDDSACFSLMKHMLMGLL